MRDPQTSSIFVSGRPQKQHRKNYPSKVFAFGAQAAPKTTSVRVVCYVLVGLRPLPFWRIARPPKVAQISKIIAFRVWAAPKAT